MTQYYWTEPGKAPVPCYVVGLATTVPESLLTIRVADPFDPGQVQKEVPATQVFKLEPFIETPQVCCGKFDTCTKPCVPRGVEIGRKEAVCGGNCGSCSCSSGAGILKM
jgi:hypothetical protein